MMLVSLQQASDHLRRDTDDDDNDLTLKIRAASQAVVNYIGVERSSEIILFDSNGEVPTDSNGDPVGVPDAVKAAVLIMVGVLYSDRDAFTFTGNVGVIPLNDTMILPKTVQWILAPYRLPRLG